LRNEFQDKAKYELNRTDRAKPNLPYTVKCRHSPSPDLNLCASGSLCKSNTAWNPNSQKIYHCRKYRLGHFAIIHRSYVTMEGGKKKNGSDISHGSRSPLSPLPPSLSSRRRKCHENKSGSYFRCFSSCENEHYLVFVTCFVLNTWKLNWWTKDGLAHVQGRRLDKSVSA